MKECGNGICRLSETECILMGYMHEPMTARLEDAAEAAASFENLGPGCPKRGKIERDFSAILAKSRQALLKLREQKP